MHSPSLPVGQHADMEEILDSMLPHVRTMAEQRPDLFSDLLSSMSEEDSVYHSEKVNIDPGSASLLRKEMNGE